MIDHTHPSRDEVRCATAEFLRTLRERADASGLARRVAVEAARATLEPEHEPLWAELEAVGVESLRAFLRATEQEEPAVPTVPAAAIEFAKTLARQRLGLAVLLNAYRAGQTSFWRAIMAEAAAEISDADVRSEVLMRVWELLSGWLDFQLAQLSEIHQSERDRFARGALARRIEVVNAIVSEQAIDPDWAERVLAHDLRHHQTAFVLWADDRAAADASSRLEPMAQQLAETVGATRPLLIPSSDGSLWGWAATSRAPDGQALAPALNDGAIKGAVGRPARGVDGFRQSHREARAAQRIAIAMKDPAALTSYRDVELLALLSHDGDAARTLVGHELSQLSGSDRASEALRETALAYLLSGGNAAATARRLGVHKNTVHDRLRRARDLLGRTVEADDTRLQLALELAQAFGTDLRALGRGL